ncbi:MAG: hypothetical protein C0605_07845 [Hyphomicrobiales bacterium]|nr:MAG: hypothetical protein C0605_07845 [Hyphomicrobiales bacterium]
MTVKYCHIKTGWRCAIQSCSQHCRLRVMLPRPQIPPETNPGANALQDFIDMTTRPGRPVTVQAMLAAGFRPADILRHLPNPTS